MNIFKKLKPPIFLKKWFGKKKQKLFCILETYLDENLQEKLSFNIYLVTEAETKKEPPPPPPFQKMMENIEFKDGKFVKRKWWHRKRKPNFYDYDYDFDMDQAELIYTDSKIIDVEAWEVPDKPMLLLDDPDREDLLLDDPDREDLLLDDPDREDLLLDDPDREDLLLDDPDQEDSIE